MGAVSSCCSVESSKDKKEVIHADAAARTDEHPGGVSSPTAVGQVTTAQLQAFQDRLEQDINMIVVIADGKRIPCRLRWTASDRSLTMLCDVNSHVHIRRISLNELVAVIHGRKDLGRVATKANIVDDPTCVALHLQSNTCIPICMETAEDRACFVEFMRQEKARPPPS
eukprot:Protomagalhaensia_wolfi_Nauph_80__1330@NODE_1794_length_1336_cov_34_888204_g1398_i0_p1_GENE_NODE_1794_length_1336_cov_34_888204_g1398_i0NODE_1794_length_1336_cov_34_888204_g1398_i0_p1_ORF_typecomplete_len198_score25_26ISP3_C/PF18045_1/1_5e28ISP1_C/PF18161_1/1_9e24SnoaL/PF07366_12/0_082_NODE_1794_length_1336_cov_34_888204_g1398_i07411247